MSAENHNHQSEKARVLFLINNLGRAGAERVFTSQANLLHAQGHAVFLATLLPEKDKSFMGELLLPRERIIFAEYHGLYDSKALDSLKNFIRVNKIETIYSTLEHASVVARLLKMKLPHVRVVRRESGTGVVGKEGKPSFKIWKFKLLDMVLNFWVDKIVVLSEEMKRLASEYQPWHKDKIIVIGNGVMVVDSETTIRERNQAKLKEKEWNILAVASMDVMERAFEYIIDALALLPEEESGNFRLIFAGDGVLRPFYEERARNKGVAHLIEFLGKLDTESLKERYKSSHIFVLSSLSEGFPNVLLEAGSFGLPAVATRAGGAVDLVQEGETGFFVPFKDAQKIAEKLIWYKKNPEKWLKMGIASYFRTRDDFSLEKIVGKILEVLKPSKI